MNFFEKDFIVITSTSNLLPIYSESVLFTVLSKPMDSVLITNKYYIPLYTHTYCNPLLKRGIAFLTHKYLIKINANSQAMVFQSLQLLSSRMILKVDHQELDI